ncbi:thiamine phosphate synthase [candidate division WOR-3 bacterium]|nr:thiamine phosphate synthase [candidate division WOR-3 bacterium]
MNWERIADVNLNRLNEALKFIEDVIRFSLENKVLLIRIRKIRNEFLKIKKDISLADIINSRQSSHDLGRAAKFDIQTKKTSEDLIIANLTRAKESARIIEEILKSINLKISNRMKEIRFQLYDLEKYIIGCLKKIFNPRINVVIDEKYLSAYRIKNMMDVLENNGVTMIQLRIKTLSDRKFYNYAVRIKKFLKKKEIKFIINNRLDIARASGADGVHLGQDDMPARMARRILGENYIIGVSAHNIDEANKAEKEGADYIGVGSIFRTKTKSDAHICGLSVLKSICKKITIPVVGIGGITNRNYRDVFRAGAAGIAVSSYLFEGDLLKNISLLTPRK